MQNSALSNKMMRSIDDEKLGEISQKQVRFYLRYSSSVIRSLQKPTFQRFLCWMLKREEIEDKKVKQVRIKVLPLRKSGQGIAGKCDPARGSIEIFPKTIKFCQMFRQAFGKNTLFWYAMNRARAALIHELLHLKYTTDETTVRKLSAEYFLRFTRKQSKKKSNVHRTLTMIFNAKLHARSPPNAIDNQWTESRLNQASLRAGCAST